VTYLSTLVALRSVHTLRKIVDPIKRWYLFVSVVCSTIYLVFNHNSKGQIKDVKNGRMTLKLWHTLENWDKRKEVLAYKKLIPKSKGIS